MEENANGVDRHSIYYTAAAISDYLNRSDWPGMPARSFVDKWGGGPTGQREADQVAWNLVSLGSFAAGDFTRVSRKRSLLRTNEPSNQGETWVC